MINSLRSEFANKANHSALLRMARTSLRSARVGSVSHYSKGNIVQIAKSFLLAVICFLSVPALSSEYGADEYKKVIGFMLEAPRPDNWHQIEIPNREIQTYEEIKNYWSEKNRTKEQFFNAAYQALLNNINDQDLVFLAINLMVGQDKNYKYDINLLEYALEENIMYRRPLKGDGWSYRGKVGDTTGGIVEKLSKRYNWTGRYKESIELIQNFLKLREAEVNDHILEFIALEHAKALKETKQLESAISVLEYGIKEYEGAREQWLQNKLAEYKKHLACETMASKCVN